MRQCPRCQQRYPDHAQVCAADGTPLVAAPAGANPQVGGTLPGATGSGAGHGAVDPNDSTHLAQQQSGGAPAWGQPAPPAWGQTPAPGATQPPAWGHTPAPGAAQPPAWGHTPAPGPHGPPSGAAWGQSTQPGYPSAPAWGQSPQPGAHGQGTLSGSNTWSGGQAAGGPPPAAGHGSPGTLSGGSTQIGGPHAGGTAGGQSWGGAAGAATGPGTPPWAGHAAATGHPPHAAGGTPPPSSALPQELPGDPKDLTNTTVGNFHIERKLGQGGMGTVYMAEHQALGTKAVVKVMHPAIAKREREARRFLNEARLASRLQHENVVRIFDFGKLPDGAPYMVMEHIPGEDLEDTIKREGGLEPPRLARILRQVASALHAAHAYPDGAIVHRDLKPANIRISMRNDQEHVTVLDFGIAREVETQADQQLTLPGAVVGTPTYMAPEQAMGQMVDHRADLYAFGAVAYESLTGELPFTGNTAMEVLMKVVSDPPPPLSPELAVPEPIRLLVERCLEKEASDRPQSAAEIMEALDAYLEELRLASIRKKMKAVVAAVLVVALLAVGAVWWLRPEGTSAPKATLADLDAAGHDLLKRDAVFIGADAAGTAEIVGRVAVTGPRPTLHVELRRTDDASPPPVEIGEDGRFRFELQELPPNRRVPFGLWLRYEDASGKQQEVPLAANKAIVYDTGLPDLQVEALAGCRRDARDPSVLYANARTVKLQISATDAGELGEEWLHLAGASSQLTSGSGGTRAVELTLAGGSGDEESIKVTATDRAGNKATRAFTVRLDLDPPGLRFVAIDGRKLNETEAEAPPFEVSASKLGAQVARVELLVAEPEPLAAIKLEVENPAGEALVLDPSQQSPDGQAIRATFALELEREGDYRLTARAVDVAGNEATLAQGIRFRVDFATGLVLTMPEAGGAALAAGADGRLYARSARLGVVTTANKRLASATLRATAEGSAPVAVPLVVDGREARGELDLPSDGVWTLVVAAEAAGGAGQNEQREEVVVDGSPPTLELLGAPWPAIAGQGFFGRGAASLQVEARVADAHGPIALTARWISEPNEAKAAGIEKALASAGAAPAGLAQAHPTLEGGVGRAEIQLVHGAHLVMGLEATDGAGNRARLARRMEIDLRGPTFTTDSKGTFKVGEPYTVRVKPSEAVLTLTVNGINVDPSVGANDVEYVFKGGPMLLDTPLELNIVATDVSGNRGAAVYAIERQNVCIHDGTRFETGIIEAYRHDPNVPPLCVGACEKPVVLRGLTATSGPSPGK